MGQLKRTFRFWTKSTFKTIFSAFVRPHLEYAAPVWSPYSKKDIAILEKVQRSATKLVPGIRNLSYHDRLLELDLTTLEERRIRGDLIRFFKLYSGDNIINFQSSVTKAPALSQSGPASGIRRNPHTLSRQSIATCAQRENIQSAYNKLLEQLINLSGYRQFSESKIALILIYQSNASSVMNRKDQAQSIFKFLNLESFLIVSVTI